MNKTVILFCCIFLIIISTTIGQQFTIQVKADCPPEDENLLLVSDDLHANFIAQTTFGDAPLSVNFKDVSTGDPTNWLWNFGDGTSDTIPFPLHVYPDPGVYTVVLTVSNSTDTSSFKRVDYIRAIAQGSCDTLNHPLPGEYTLYTILGNNSGYISGNNIYGTLALASYFDVFEEGGEVVAGIFDFAVAKRSLTNNIPVYFKIWDATGNSGSPGQVLDSVSILISSIVANVDAGQSTMLLFEESALVDGPFFMGVELPQIYGDTLALYTNYDGDVETGNGWEKDINGTWQSYANTQWGLDIDNAIFPVMCQQVGIENPELNESITIFPVPAGDVINFVFNDESTKVLSVSLFDMTGRQALNYQMDGSYFGNINITAVYEGFYFLRFDTSVGAMNKKFVIRR